MREEVAFGAMTSFRPGQLERLMRTMLIVAVVAVFFAVPSFAQDYLIAPDYVSDLVEPITVPDTGGVIDVLLVYTRALDRHLRDSRNVYDRRTVKERIQSLAAFMNQALRRSRSRASIRINCMLRVRMNLDLYGTAREVLEALTFKNDGKLNGVHRRRDRCNSDVVVLMYYGEGGPCCGIAWLGVGNPDYAFAAVWVTPGDRLSVSGDYYSTAFSTFAHELGHVLGIAHHRASQLINGATQPKDVRPPWAFGFVRCPTRRRKGFETIMAGSMVPLKYACPFGEDYRYESSPPYLFSNPAVRINGLPIGVRGREITNQVNGPANAVRAINKNRKIVANYRRSGN